MIFLPHFVVWTERITAIIALVSALALYLPVSTEFLTAALYIQYACCCFMIGFETAIIVGLFTERTAVLHLSVAYGIANAFVAVLHNDFVKIGFPVFRLFSVIALAMMILFFFRLPGNVWTQSVKRTDGLTAPKTFFAGIMLWVGMSCCLILFGNAVAEGTPHGVSVFYLATALSCIAVYVFWMKFGVSPFRCLSVYVAVGAMGFILAIASLYIPALLIVACVFLGCGSVCLLFNPFFGVLLAKTYPSRFISPAIIGIAYLMVLIHSILLDLLRDNLPVLYIVYLIIAVGMVILYFIMEPYLMFSFRNKVITTEPAAINAAPIGETLTSELENNWRETLQANAVEPLTDGELDIAGFIMLGYTNENIAKETRYAYNTVKSYRKNIYSKLDIHTTRELFQRANRSNR
jgi:DNA-binding CsgD family transcriptional regulator